MSADKWYMAVDQRSGVPYYYNQRGDTTYERPATYAGAVASQSGGQSSARSGPPTPRSGPPTPRSGPPTPRSGPPQNGQLSAFNGSYGGGQQSRAQSGGSQRSGDSGGGGSQRSGGSGGSGGNGGRVMPMAAPQGKPSPQSAQQQMPQQQRPPQQTQQASPSQSGARRSPVKLRVLFPHVARYEDELTLRPGELVTGIQKVEGGTWWYGELPNGRRGHFPANFVEELRDEAQALPAPRGRASFIGGLGVSTRLQGQPTRQQNLQAQNYGGAGPGYYQPDLTPARPEKPAEIAAGNKPRDQRAVKGEETKLAEGAGGKSTLKYTFWAHMWGYAFALYAIVLGGFAELWFLQSQLEPPNSLKQQLLGTPFFFTGPAVAGTGLLALLFEYAYGLKKTDAMYNVVCDLPYRGIFYLALSVPSFTSYATVLAGAIGVIASGVHTFADLQGERGTAERKNLMFRISPAIIFGWSFTQATIVLVFLAINAGLYLFRWNIVEQERLACLVQFNGDPNQLNCLSEFAAHAKGAGTALDFTCAFIVVPVMRAMIKRVSTVEVSPNRTLATVIPLKKNIQGHKIIALSIAVMSVVHTAAHMANFAFAPIPSLAAFGALALFTGGALALFFTVIFCAAHETVRRSSFEVFWWSHHFFLLCFPLILAHGPKYWFAAAVTIPLYALDRLVRARRGTKTMMVDYVRFSSPVLKLHFFPQRKEDFMFREGQYLYIQCPFINEYEWHPFTISSCYGDLEKEGYVSLHIRVQAKGSWTWQLMEYFKMLAGKGGAPQVPGPDGKKVDAPFESFLTHFDSAGVVQRGKHFGPDGKALIRIDGPHAAPAQTYSTYKDVMLVGSGIGLTPSAAILSAVTKYKWAKGFQPETLRFFWVVRHAELDSFEWFIELLDTVSRRVVADRKAGAITAFHRLEINIYVTAVPSNVEVLNQVPVQLAEKNALKARREKEFQIQDAGMLDTYIGFDVTNIKALLKSPTVLSKEQAKMQYGEYGYYNKLPNRLGYIYAYNGRPDWDGIFAAVREARHKGVNEVGVCYCGAPNIGDDLKTNCAKFTGPGCTFTLNKEVF